MLYALHSFEAEVLLQRNTWFVVTQIEGTKICLSEIPAESVDNHRQENSATLTYPL